MGMAILLGELTKAEQMGDMERIAELMEAKRILSDEVAEDSWVGPGAISPKQLKNIADRVGNNLENAINAILASGGRDLAGHLRSSIRPIRTMKKALSYAPATQQTEWDTT